MAVADFGAERMALTLVKTIPTTGIALQPDSRFSGMEIDWKCCHDLGVKSLSDLKEVRRHLGSGPAFLQPGEDMKMIIPGGRYGGRQIRVQRPADKPNTIRISAINC